MAHGHIWFMAAPPPPRAGRFFLQAGRICGYACIWLHTHAYARICMHMPSYACICLHVHAYACICMQMPTYACICMHMHTYSCIRFHRNAYVSLGGFPLSFVPKYRPLYNLERRNTIKFATDNESFFVAILFSGL